MKRPVSFYLLEIVLILQVFSGLYGGLSLIFDSSGAGLGMKVAQLHSIFPSFLIPGLVLTILLSLLPLFIFMVLIFQPKWMWPERINLFHNFYWGWTFALYVGIMLIIWIDIQLLVVQEYIFLQPVFSLVGVTIVILVLWPSNRLYFSKI